MPKITALMLALAVVFATAALSATQVEPDDRQRQTFARALVLAGRPFAGLPIVITAVPPVGASKGIDAWTTYGTDGQGERIFVYTEGESFRCGGEPAPEGAACQLKLASIVVHEAWHLRHGPSEAGAYYAQLTFLLLHGGSHGQIASVGLARSRVLTAERQVTLMAWRRFGSH